MMSEPFSLETALTQLHTALGKADKHFELYRQAIRKAEDEFITQLVDNGASIFLAQPEIVSLIEGTDPAKWVVCEISHDIPLLHSTFDRIFFDYNLGYGLDDVLAIRGEAEIRGAGSPTPKLNIIIAELNKQ